MKKLLAVISLLWLAGSGTSAGVAAPLTPEEMDTVCRHFAAVVEGIAVQREAGRPSAEVKDQVHELLKDLAWSFPLLDEAADKVYGLWAIRPPKQVRTLWHTWCMTTALTPEKPGR